MTALVERAPGVYLPPGVQQPRHLWVPEYDFSHGEDAIALARVLGMEPDEWQQFVVVHMLGVRGDGTRPDNVRLKWAAFEVGLEVARQNGKGGVYEIRELAGLFLLGERLLVHSAHEYKTAEQALDRMEALLQADSEIWALVRTIKRSHGQEGIYLKSGQVLRYVARTASALRGFSCDFLGVDEAMKIKASMLSSVFPTMSARPNAQILYAGSAVDQETMPDGVVFAKVRERGIAGGDPRLAFFGWSAPFEHPSKVTLEDAQDPANWAAANPALGIGSRTDGSHISHDYIEIEQRALSARGFAVERLGVGDWPDTSEEADRKITRAAWKACLDPHSTRTGAVVFAFAVSEDRSTACISAAGPRADGEWHVERIDHRPGQGTDWVVDRLKGLAKMHRPAAILWRKDDPANSLAGELETAKIRKLKPASASEFAQACGVLFDSIERVDPETGDRRPGTLHHIGQPELTAAVDGAATKPYGDGGWVWRQMASDADITPLVSCTLALWATVAKKKRSGGVINLAEVLAAAENHS
jgi:hypothetical protein